MSDRTPITLADYRGALGAYRLAQILGDYKTAAHYWNTVIYRGIEDLEGITDQQRADLYTQFHSKYGEDHQTNSAIPNMLWILGLGEDGLDIQLADVVAYRIHELERQRAEIDDEIQRLKGVGDDDKYSNML